MRMSANLTDDEAEAIIRTHSAKEAWVMLKKMIFDHTDERSAGPRVGTSQASTEVGSTTAPKIRS